MRRMKLLEGLVTTLAGGVFALLGVWLSPIFQRRSKKSGHVRYRLSDLTWEDEHHPRGYTFVAKIFNEMEQGTGIQDVDVRFYDHGNNELELTDRPRDTGTGYYVDYLNLPAQQWTVRKLKAGDMVERPREMRRAKSCKARLVVCPPGNREYEINIPKKDEGPEERIIPGTQH